MVYLVPTGVVTVARRCWDRASTVPLRWSQSEANFSNSRLHVSSSGTIEDQGVGLLQVDFANKFLGGGVLGQGCVQEEIRFVICPELFVTKLVAEVLQTHEAVFIVGCERFSSYSGYASSFVFAGEFVDDTPFDASRRRCCSIVAIDALNFHRPSDQYRDDLMHRELDKALVGYGPWLATPAPGVATGNWGCGAFGGDKRLKALLQLMACCVTGRPLVYYTFGDRPLARDLLEVFRFLRREKITVGSFGVATFECPEKNLFFCFRKIMVIFETLSISKTKWVPVVFIYLPGVSRRTTKYRRRCQRDKSKMSRLTGKKSNE